MIATIMITILTITVVILSICLWLTAVEVNALIERTNHIDAKASRADLRTMRY